VDHFYGPLTGRRTSGSRAMVRVAVVFSRGELLRLSIDRAINSLLQTLLRKTVSLAGVICSEGVSGRTALDRSRVSLAGRTAW